MKIKKFNKRALTLILTSGIALSCLTGCSAPIPTISAFTEESDDITLTHKVDPDAVLICELDYAVYGKRQRNIFFAKMEIDGEIKMFFDLFSGKLLATYNVHYFDNYLINSVMLNFNPLRQYIDINSESNANTFSYQELYSLLIELRNEYNEIGFDKMFYYKQK